MAMFYRFNAHRERPLGRGKKQDSEAALDQAARKLVSAVIRFQRRWAALMRKFTEKVPGNWLRILAVVGFAAAGYFYLNLIIARQPPASLVSVQAWVIQRWQTTKTTQSIQVSSDSLARRAAQRR